MRLAIKVIPNAGKEEIIEEGGAIKVKVRAAPEDGKANAAAIALLAARFGVKKKDVRLVRGGKSREKEVEIAGKWK